MSTTRTCEQYRETIVALREGLFDGIEAERMRAAEKHLNECEGCRALLADASARPEAGLRDAMQLPTEQAWDDAWERVAAVGGGSRGASTQRILRLARPWGTFAAAAVVMLMVSLWRVMPDAESTGWALQLAGVDDVEVESLETFGDSTSMLMTAGDDDEISIIWVMDDEGV